MGTKDNDYAYIQIFIDYLKQIIELIKNLFAGLGGATETTTEPVTE